MRGVTLQYSGISVTFARCPSYPSFNLQYVQPEERTSAGIPIVYSPLFYQKPFTATWPEMTDAELDNLRTFMQTTVPLFGTILFSDLGRGYGLSCRFTDLKLGIEPTRLGHNRVTVNMAAI